LGFFHRWVRRKSIPEPNFFARRYFQSIGSEVALKRDGSRRLDVCRPMRDRCFRSGAREHCFDGFGYALPERHAEFPAGERNLDSIGVDAELWISGEHGDRRGQQDDAGQKRRHGTDHPPV